MSQVELSILMPGIRDYNWVRLYESTLKATRRSFELIIVSPYPLPASMSSNPSIKYIRDFGNPVRCQNIALINAEGKYCTWVADDSVWLPGGLDDCIDALETMGDSVKNAVIAKYYEGHNRDNQDSGDTDAIMSSDAYYYILPSHLDIAEHNKGYLMFNLSIMYTEYVRYLGGMDCRFNIPAIGILDMGIRAHRDGCKCQLRGVIAAAGHMPGTSGDHAPVHYTQSEHDEPIYMNLIHETSRRIVDINDWKTSPRVWQKRFGNL